MEHVRRPDGERPAWSVLVVRWIKSRTSHGKRRLRIRNLRDPHKRHACVALSELCPMVATHTFSRSKADSVLVMRICKHHALWLSYRFEIKIPQGDEQFLCGERDE